MTTKDYASKYWLCTPCAIEQGGKPSGDACTVIMGKCGHCKSDIDQTLTPWVDFNWKTDSIKDLKAKMGRD